MIRLLSIVFLLFLVLPSTTAFAADDPSIKGELRAAIQSSMQAFLDRQTVDGVFRHYDPVESRLLVLSEPHVHKGIVKKGDVYVSCADFVDQSGRRLDVDFFVVGSLEQMTTIQALVHKVDGKKRPYDLTSD